jgi:hypothetical protein
MCLNIFRSETFPENTEEVTRAEGGVQASHCNAVSRQLLPQNIPTKPRTSGQISKKTSWIYIARKKFYSGSCKEKSR